MLLALKICTGQFILYNQLQQHEIMVGCFYGRVSIYIEMGKRKFRLSVHQKNYERKRWGFFPVRLPIKGGVSVFNVSVPLSSLSIEQRNLLIDQSRNSLPGPPPPRPISELPPSSQPRPVSELPPSSPPQSVSELPPSCPLDPSRNFLPVPTLDLSRNSLPVPTLNSTTLLLNSLLTASGIIERKAH